MSKCPVCKKEYSAEDSSCINCGFDQLNKEFINQDELMRWMEETVFPCQKIYKAMDAKLRTTAHNSLQPVLQKKTEGSVNLTKEAVCNQIQAALRNSESFSDDFPDDPLYFDFEEETGMITNHLEKRIQCPQVQRYSQKGLRIIGYNGFENKRVIIPSEINGRPVVSIGEKVFMNTSVSEVVLPKSLKAILRSAFEGCKNLKKIFLPDGITYLGSECFKNSGLEEFICPESIAVIPNCCFQYCEQLQKVHLGTHVSKLEYFAFLGCTSLSNISLPESLTEIEDGCFKNTAIKTIIIPPNVQKIHVEVFGGTSWEISAKHKHQITCVFLGKDADTYTTVGSHGVLNRVSLIYCLPGSKIQKTAREHSIPIKPLSEFRLEDYQ